MRKNIVYSPAKFVIVDLIGDFLYWPIWWYSRGLIKTLKGCLFSIKNQGQRLGIAIWIKNIFTPMFGQYDIEGRLISFFARLVQIIIRSIILAIWVIVIFLGLLFYLGLPILIVSQIWANFRWVIS